MNKILSSYYNRIIKEYDDILLCYQYGNKSYNSITYSLFIHRDAVYVKAN